MAALRTTTSNVRLVEFPAASVAVHVTAVVPIANDEPDAGRHDGTTAPSTRSVAVTLNLTVAPAGEVAFALTTAGASIVGAVVSCTVTTKSVVAVLPPSRSRCT